MAIGGFLLVIFIPLHIMHFTTGTIRPAGTFDPVNVYGNIVDSFRIWWVTAFYVITMAFLGLPAIVALGSSELAQIGGRSLDSLVTYPTWLVVHVRDPSLFSLIDIRDSALRNVPRAKR